MSGSCIEKLPHKTATCNSSDGLQVFNDNGKYSGYCFACSTYVPDPYHDREANYQPVKISKTPEQIQEELKEIETLPYLALEERKLERATLEYFGIRTAVSEEDGQTPIALYCPYYAHSELCGYKVNLLNPKNFFIVGALKDAELFGWQQAIQTGAKRLYITEGEKDAASLFQALKNKQKGSQYEKHNPAVVSIINGAASAAKELLKNSQLIRKHFKGIVLVFDQDKAGKEAVEAVLRVLPEAIVATVPGKDPNDCLVKGHSNGLANAVLFNSQSAKNTRLVNISSLYDKAREPAQYGLSWPWEGLTKATRGIIFGNTYFFGAGVKMGKSEIVDTLAAWLVTEHNLKVFLAKPEQALLKSVKMLLGKVVGKFFHDPDKAFDYEAYDKAEQIVGDKVELLDLYQHIGWASLKSDILEAVQAGCKAVFIDPITNLTNGVQAGEANTVLQEIAQELAAMAKDLDIVIFIFCHLKSPENGPSHERGGAVMSHQFTGSRAMARSCNYMLGLEGNKSPELPVEQRNMRKLVILEDREFGTSDIIHLYWNPDTGQFQEVKTL